MNDIDNVTLDASQSKVGIKAAIQFKNREFKKRNIITKDQFVPVKDKDGNIVKDQDGNPVMRWVTIPTFIPEIEKEAIKIFVDSYPCWFDGCEDIRKAYKEEVERTLGPDGCTSCKKGAILRKYLKQAVDALQKSKNT